MEGGQAAQLLELNLGRSPIRCPGTPAAPLLPRGHRWRVQEPHAGVELIGGPQSSGTGKGFERGAGLAGVIFHRIVLPGETQSRGLVELSWLPCLGVFQAEVVAFILLTPSLVSEDGQWWFLRQGGAAAISG